MSQKYITKLIWINNNKICVCVVFFLLQNNVLLGMFSHDTAQIIIYSIEWPEKQLYVQMFSLVLHSFPIFA